MSVDIKALLAEAELPEDSVDICLRTSLQHDFEAAEARLEAAEKANRDQDSLGGGPVDLEPIVAEIEALREQMKAKTVTFKFRALPRRRWTALWAEHPPREDSEVDKRWGINEVTFFAALLEACCYEPTMTPVDWETLIDKVTDWQYQVLTTVAWNLNQAPVRVPFSPAASRIRATSANASSARPTSDSL